MSIGAQPQHNCAAASWGRLKEVDTGSVAARYDALGSAPRSNVYDMGSERVMKVSDKNKAEPYVTCVAASADIAPTVHRAWKTANSSTEYGIVQDKYDYTLAEFIKSRSVAGLFGRASCKPIDDAVGTLLMRILKSQDNGSFRYAQNATTAHHVVLRTVKGVVEARIIDWGRVHVCAPPDGRFGTCGQNNVFGLINDIEKNIRDAGHSGGINMYFPYVSSIRGRIGTF